MAWSNTASGFFLNECTKGAITHKCLYIEVQLRRIIWVQTTVPFMYSYSCVMKSTFVSLYQVDHKTSLQNFFMKV